MNNHLSRRSVLLAPALLPLVDGLQEAQAKSGEIHPSASKTLVAYYNRYPKEKTKKGWSERKWQVQKQLLRCKGSCRRDRSDPHHRQHGIAEN